MQMALNPKDPSEREAGKRKSTPETGLHLIDLAQRN